MPISPYFASLLLLPMLLLPSDVWQPPEQRLLTKHKAWKPPTQRYCEQAELWPLKILCERRSAYFKRHRASTTSTLNRFDF